MEYITNADLLKLDGKIAIVTGGAKGIGLGIVKRFVEAGAKVLIADLDEEAGKKAARQMGEMNAEFIKCDVTKANDVQAAVDMTVKDKGKIDILVNNAGIFPNVPLAQMTEEDFMKVMDCNLRGVYLFTKKVSDQMIKQGNGGSIINITSIDAIKPSMIGFAHYDTSKHGLLGFTKSTALELAEHKIWVNAIAPGGVQTPGMEAMNRPETGVDMKAQAEAFLAKIPMHRIGDPDEIGKVALFLASPMSSYMTGSQVIVDGGALLS